MGWIAAFGQAGSAAIPFVTGVLAEKFSVRVLQPVMLALLGSMGVLWLFVPRVERRVD